MQVHVRVHPFLLAYQHRCSYPVWQKDPVLRCVTMLGKLYLSASQFRRMAWFARDVRLHDFAIQKTMRILELEGIPHEYVNAKKYDLVVEGKRVEVKFDTWIGVTGNISAEYWVLHKGQGRTQGWVQPTESDAKDADILVYVYNFDNAFALDMRGLKAYVARNCERLPAKKAYGQKRGAINLLVHLSLIPDLRLSRWEAMFRKYAVMPPKDERTFQAPVQFRNESSLSSFSRDDA